MKKLIPIIAMMFCLVSVAGAWDEGGWDTSKVPYIKKTTAPAVTDDDFGIPYLWVDETNDKLYLLIDNTPGAASWIKLQGGIENAIIVAGSGGDYTDLSDAIDAATAGNTVLVYPGTYTDTMTFGANIITVIGVGAMGNVIVTQVDAAVVDFNSRSGICIQNMTLQVTAATTAIATITGTTGSIIVKKCLSKMTTSAGITAINQPAVGLVSGNGTLRLSEGDFVYAHTGDGGGTAQKGAFRVGTGGTIHLEMLNHSTITNSGTELITAVVVDTSSTGIAIMHDCGIDIVDTGTLVTGLAYLGGTGITHEFSRNTIHIDGTGCAVAWGFYSADTASTSHFFYNHIHVTGASTNYSYYIGTNATVISHFDDLVASGGYSNSGTFHSVSSFADGNLMLTGALLAATLNSGQGAYELYAMNQDVESTDAVSFASVNTGQGANALYDMDQNVQQADSPVFVTTKLSGLGNGFIPYHIDDATGLDNSPMSTDGTDVDFAGGYATQLQNIPDLASRGASYWLDGVNDDITITDAANIQMGTGDFSYVVSFMFAETGAEGIIFGKRTVSGSPGWGIGKYTGEQLLVFLRAGEYVDVDTGVLPIGVNYTVGVTITRDENMLTYKNGLLLNTTNISTNTGTVDDGADLVIGDRSNGGIDFNGSVSRGLLFNLALTATEVNALSSGAEVPFKYVGASQTAKYASDYNGGVDNTESTRLTLDAPIDGIGGEDDTLRGTLTGGSASHYFQFDDTAFGAAFPGKHFRLSFDVWIPNGNTKVDGVKIQVGDFQSIHAPSVDTWTTYVDEMTLASTSKIQIFALDGGTSTIDQDGDLIYLKNVVITQIGCVLNLNPEGITAGTWVDSSGNNLDGTVSGAIVTNPRPISYIQATTNDGTTDGIQVVDSDEVEVYTVDSDGNVEATSVAARATSAPATTSEDSDADVSGRVHGKDWGNLDDIGDGSEDFHRYWQAMLNGTLTTFIDWNPQTETFGIAGALMVSGNVDAASYTIGAGDEIRLPAPGTLTNLQYASIRTITLTSGYGTTAIGDLVYLDGVGNNDKFEKTDGNAAATAADVLVGIVLEAVSTDTPCKIMLEGTITVDAWNWADYGVSVFISGTAGEFTDTRLAVTNDIVRIMGYVLDDDTIYFSPDSAYATVD